MTSVPVWDMAAIASFHPELRITASASAPDLLASLATGLASARFKIRRRTADGFTARYVDWVSIASASLNRTSLEVSTTSGGAGSEALVRGGYEGTDRTGRKRAAQGLTAAVRDLESRGVVVGTTAWTAPEK